MKNLKNKRAKLLKSMVDLYDSATENNRVYQPHENDLKLIDLIDSEILNRTKHLGLTQ